MIRVRSCSVTTIIMFSRSLSSLAISPTNLSALRRAGFDSVDDLGSLTAEQLSEELKIPTFLCEEILRASRKPLPSLTQPAATLLNSARSVFSVPEPMKNLLDRGGLKKGHILELSGPPGSPKEAALLEILRSAVLSEEDVILYAKYDDPVENTDCIESNSRTSLFEQIKAILAKVCASRHLTVVITVQLATKMIGADGAIANFDTAKKAIMVPQLGDAYLPSSRSHRLIFVPTSPTTGKDYPTSVVSLSTGNAVADRAGPRTLRNDQRRSM
ncbi:hypothetical protein A7U60_g6598 [Sanghuangporus baumii]|uniref:DNA recombination and repair protein Rad51-like C-terminal domain-containing protein n=1 Tax=Sanghuangporus baumii TaxID=108892 RepID=A0A9Q5HUQ3_SANBA|nr:hypothetical protein A7U60_g6598 [Sanghuangporus baumii]